MWNELLLWIEQYSGCGYDLDGYINDLDGYSIFLDPFEWICTFDEFGDSMYEIYDVFDQFGDSLPESKFEPIEITRRKFDEFYLGKIQKVFINIQKKLNLSEVEAKSLDELTHQASAINELICMLIDNDIETILKQDMFESLDDDVSNILTDEFKITSNDLNNLKMIITSIQEANAEDDE